MRQGLKSRTRGFTLIELMVALTCGLIVVGAAVKLYSTGMDATWVIQQRAEMQQDLRATENVMLRDISLAGAGLSQIPGESISLPNGVSPVYGCSAGPICAPNGAVNYPNIGGAGPTLYPIMPGFALGIKPPGSAIPSDMMTVVYSDTNLAMNCFSGPLNPAGTGATAADNGLQFNAAGNVLTFTAPVNPPPSNCVLPPGITYPQALNNTVNGLQPGDLILVGPLGNAYVVGEVTGVAPANPGNTPAAPGSQYVITFADGDTLHLNQSGQLNDLTTFNPKAGTGGQVASLQANRIFVITYYLKNWTDAGGNTTTILYRQVNGQPAIPLADNIANMQFTYDSYNDDGTLLTQAGDAGASLGYTPNDIRKINLVHLTIHSQIYGVKSSLMATQGFQSFDLQTSMSARNASFNNRY